MNDTLILANLIKSWVQKAPDLDVLTFVSINKNDQLVDERRTYQQLWDNGQKLAVWLKSLGMKKGDTFALVMANHPEFVDLMVASSIVGTIFVPIDPRTTGQKLRYMLDFAECKGAVVAGYALDNVRSEWQSRDDRWLATLGHYASDYCQIESVLRNEVASPPLAVNSTDPDAAMQMLYTSGTTGDPKAILSSHRRFGDVAKTAEVLGLTPDDRPYTGLSLTHANAQLITLGNCLVLGMRGVISHKFTKSRLWDITRRYGCTYFNLLGGMTTAIFAEPKKANDADNPVRRIISAGMPEPIWLEFCRRFNVELLEIYGAAEGGLTINLPQAGPVGSCGKPISSLEMKIFNDSDQECKPGESGEICFRSSDGSTPAVNYYKNIEDSLKKTQGGWLRMGDVGHVDEEGWLFFDYRKGGGLRRNGDFVNTALVEKALSEIDSIDDVFVYGVPALNGSPGEKDIVAAIVPTNCTSFDGNKVFSLCREKLAAGLIPTYLHLVDVIPKTASEKPQERILLEAFDPNENFIITDHTTVSV